MASDTAPAAVPGPNDPPPSTAPTTPATSGPQQPTDGLAGLLAPVQPTRTAFSLDPDDTAATAQGEHNVTDASSAAYADGNTPTDTTGNRSKTAAGKQERSVIKAWMLAGAERWRKGGDARNKRLDVKKARAQARQVKETVTVNRSEKTGGGSSNSSTGNNSGGGKSLGSKSSKASSGTGPKNSPKNSPSKGSGSSGGSGSGSRTPSGSGTGRGTGGGTSRSDKTATPKPNRGPKPVKDGPGKTPSSGPGKTNTSGGGTAGHKPAADKTKDSGSGGGKQGQRQQRNGGTSSSGKPGAQGPAGKPGSHAPSGDTGQGKGTRQQTASDRPWKNRTPGDKTSRTTDPTKNPDANKAGPAEPQTSPKPGPAAPPGTLGKGLWKSLFTTKPDGAPNSGPGKDVPHAPKTLKTSKRHPAPAPAPRPRVDTRTSREAGYRDGTRVGKVVAHTQAYRHGYRDGRTDTTQAAAADKQRLDQAHAARKNARTQPEDKPVTQPLASSADYQQAPPKPTHTPGPRPVPVNHVDATHVHLGSGAARPTISRGEVRTLRRFQQRLDDKNDRMTTVAEATRTLEHHANEQAKQVTQLLEQARGVKGGQKLVASLSKLAEAANVQAAKAAEIHKRAVRSGEACKTLTANTETRYGGIYKAVVDSPETTPAEMNYYREMSHA